MEKVLVHDISYHQGDLAKYWPLFKAKGVQAIIIQATNGLAYQQYFHDTAKIAKAQGFYVGSYHYFRQQIRNVEGSWYTCDPLKQAQNYFNWVQKSGVKMDLPPVLDVENGGNPYLSSTTVQNTLSFIEKLFGQVPMLYSSPSVLNGFAKDTWTKYPLWLAHYTTEDKIQVPKPWKTWTLWQYSDKVTYTPPGSTVRKPIDHNYFNGDLASFRKFFKLAAGGTQPTTPPVVVPDDLPLQPEEIAALKAKVAQAIDEWARTL
jgi:lysozyme